MAVTLASLRADHPEFDTFDATALQSAIDRATNRIDDTTLQDATQLDEAITWLACWIAATSPYARDRRRKGELGVPEGYLYEYEQIVKYEARAHRFITGQTG